MKQQYYRLTILTRKVSMRFVGANGNETTILTPHVTNAKGKYLKSASYPNIPYQDLRLLKKVLLTNKEGVFITN